MKARTKLLLRALAAAFLMASWQVACTGEGIEATIAGAMALANFFVLVIPDSEY